jgi:hypothetical protein
MDEIRIKALIDAGDSAKTIGELKKALRDLKSASLGVAEGSKAFDDITKAAGELQDKIGDLNARTKNLGSDLKNLEGFLGIGQGIAGAFSAMQGAAALFGSENKQLEESLLKVQAAMGILQGIQAVANVLQKESSAMLLVNNALRKISAIFTKEQAVASTLDATAKEAEAIATGEAAVAQQGLNTAMKANPVLALVGLITTAVAALWAFSDSSNEAGEAQKKLNEDIRKTRDTSELEIKTFEANIKALKELKTGSEERAAMLAKINKEYGFSLKNLTDEEKFIKQVNIAVNDYIAGAKRRLTTKINEAKAETFLQQAQEKRYEKEEKLIQKNRLLKEGYTKNDPLILAINKDIQTLGKLELGYQAKADKVLDINAQMLAKETAQEKKAREDADKKEKDDADKKALDDADRRRKDAATAAKNKADEDKRKLEALEAYGKAQANTIKSINDFINGIEDASAKEFLNIWKDTYLEKVSMIDYNLKAEVTKYKDEYAKIYQNISEEFKASPIYVKFLEDSRGIKTPEEFKEAYDRELNKYISNNTILSTALSGAQNTLNKQIEVATRTAATNSAKAWKDAFESVREEVKAATRSALPTDELKAFYQILELNNKEVDKAVEKQNKGVKEAQALIIQTNIEKIQAIQKEIDARTKLNDKLGEGATIENMRVMLSKEGDAEKRKDIENAIKDAEKKNAIDKVAIQLLQDNIDASNTLLEQQERLTKEASMPTDNINVALDNLQTKMKLASPFGEYNKELGETLDMLEHFPNKLFYMSKYTEKEYRKMIDASLSQLYNLGRSTEESALHSNKLVASLYRDKRDLIVYEEDKINSELSKIWDEAQKQATKSNDTNTLELLNSLKTTEGEFKEFQSNVTDSSKQFGIDMLTVLFPAKSNEFSKLLKDRSDLIVSSEERTYTDMLLIQQQALQEGTITEKEYKDEVEKINMNHQENLLIMDIAYGKKSMSDLVKFYDEKAAYVKSKEDEDKARRMANLEAVLAIERQLQQWLFQELSEGIDKRSAAIQRELDQDLNAIDTRQNAYEMASSEMTAKEKADKIAMDSFDLQRKDAQDKAAAEQQALEKERFDADKTNKAIQVGLEYALAIAKAWGTLGPFGAPMAVFLGAQALIAEAAILSAEYVPAFAEGGYVTGPGGPKDDKINAKLSNGESVINAKSTKMFGPILSAMNVAGGGKAFPMATGGMVTPEMVSASTQYDMGKLEYILEKYASRPIETYVKEVNITNAQKDASRIDRRTKF